MAQGDRKPRYLFMGTALSLSLLFGALLHPAIKNSCFRTEQAYMNEVYDSAFTPACIAMTLVVALSAWLAEVKKRPRWLADTLLLLTLSAPLWSFFLFPWVWRIVEAF